MAVRQHVYRAAIIALTLLYLFVLRQYAQNLPFWDDYDAILGRLQGFGQDGDLIKLLFTPHNEHLIATGSLIALLYWKVMGTLNFAHLIGLGNLALIGLAALCWYLAPQGPRRDPRLALIGLLLLLNFAYWEGSLWSVTALANFPVLLFATACLQYLGRSGDHALLHAPALLLAALASFSQGNGMLLFPLACLWLATQRRWGGAALWLLAAIGYASFYLWCQRNLGMTVSAPSPLLDNLAQPLALGHYLLSFIGALAGSTPEGAWAPILGVVLLPAALYAAWQSRREEPARALLIVFILLTAGVTAVSRLGHGLAYASSSRYAVNSGLLLLLTLAWFWPVLARQHWRAWLLVGLAGAANAASYSAVQLELTQRQLRTARLTSGDEEFCGSTFNFPEQAKAWQRLHDARKSGLYGRQLRLLATPCKLPHQTELHLLVGQAPHHLAAGVGGGLDSLRAEGEHVLASGWLQMDPLAVGRQLYVALPIQPQASSLTHYLREDVAQVLGDEAYNGSGFNLLLRFRDAAEAQQALREMCLGFGYGDDRSRHAYLLPNPNAACKAYLS